MRGLVLGVALLVAIAVPGHAQLLDHSLAVENQLLLLDNFPGPEEGELAQDGVIDGLYLSGGLTWGVGPWVELHLDADLGVIYDDEDGATALRATIHRAYLQGEAGEGVEGRLRGGIIPHRIANGLLLDSDEPTLDLRLRRASGATREGSLLLQALLVEGESPFLRAMASVDALGRGHLSLWGGYYQDRSGRLEDQATAGRNLLLLRRLQGDARLRQRLASPRGGALLDAILAERVVSDGHLWLAGVDGAWSWPRLEVSAVAVYERGDYQFHGDVGDLDFDASVAAWLANAELRLTVADRVVAGPFVLYLSGDDRVVDDRLTSFLPIAPFSPYATLFFNGSLNRDFLAGTFQPVELASFGVVAGGASAQVTAAGDLFLDLSVIYLQADRVPAEIDSDELGWEVDTRLTWLAGDHWSLSAEWDWFVPGDLVDALGVDADTMQLFAATVRYAF